MIVQVLGSKGTPSSITPFLKILTALAKPFHPFPFGIHKQNGIVLLLFQIMSLVFTEHFLFQTRHARHLYLSLTSDQISPQPTSDKPRQKYQPFQCPEDQFFSLQTKDII